MITKWSTFLPRIKISGAGGNLNTSASTSSRAFKAFLEL